MKKMFAKGDHVICHLGEAVVIADDGMFVVCQIEDGRIISSPKISVGYIPTEKEIQNKCETMQKKWTRRQKFSRTSPSDRHYPVEIPGGERYGMPVSAAEDRLRFLDEEKEDE